MIGTRRGLDPTAAQNTVAEDKTKPLGRVGGHDYLTFDGKEYAVDVHATSDPGEFNRRNGEIIVNRRKRETIDGTPWETTLHHRGWPVEPGSYAKLAAKQEARRARQQAETPLRAWDVLVGLFSSRRDPYRIVTGATAADPTLDALKAATDTKAARPAWIEIKPQQEPERGPAGIVAYLESRGIELSLGRGRLIARSRKTLNVVDRELIERTEELIVGHLKGQPAVCSLCSELAVLVAFPRAPMCAEHAQ
jgi:hypothetical protein